MVLDQLLRLRDGGGVITSKAAGGGEAGVTTTAQGSGAAVVPVYKTPALRGLAIVAALGGVTNETATPAGTLTITVEAADEDNFSDKETVGTFPAITAPTNGKKFEASLVIRQVSTQKKLLRTVVTEGAASDTNYITLASLAIFVGDMIAEGKIGGAEVAA